MLRTTIVASLITQSMYFASATTPALNFECSTCSEYYPNVTSPEHWDTWKNYTAPLTDHACGSSGDVSRCCVKVGANCFIREDQGSPSYPCGGSCNLLPNNRPYSPGVPTAPVVPTVPPTEEEENSVEPEDDCSACTEYFPSASMDREESRRGESVSLLNHACARSADGDWSHSNDPVDISRCCRSGPKGQCGVVLPRTNFLIYPCNHCSTSTSNIEESSDERPQSLIASICYTVSSDTRRIEVQ